MLEAALDRMRQPIKIDISTDDVITLRAIQAISKVQVDMGVLKQAFDATCTKRETMIDEAMIGNTIRATKEDNGLRELWDRFKNKNYFVGNIEWDSAQNFVIKEIKILFKITDVYGNLKFSQLAH